MSSGPAGLQNKTCFLPCVLRNAHDAAPYAGTGSACQLFFFAHLLIRVSSQARSQKLWLTIIYKIKIIKHNDKLELIFVGNGFLKHMVRNIVGILIKVGNGLFTTYEVETILEEKTRKHNTKPVPGNGLYLWNVYYK